MMLILSPEERAHAWHDAISAPAPDREYKRHVLALSAFEMLGSELSLYGDEYAAALKDSFDLLDRSGLIGRAELREAFEEIDEERGTARAFAAALGRQLRESAAIARLSDEDRDRAAQLAEQWREAAAEAGAGVVEDDGESYMTVAEVAAIYDVTPQAVYKWIHKGVLDAHPRPGGSYRVPIEALSADERFDVARARRLQRTLTRRHEAAGEVPAKEMLEQMRLRRRPSSR
jgi:excisionase family DNA binding protein